MLDPILTLPRGAPPPRLHVPIAELDGDEVVYAVLPLAPLAFLVAVVALVARAVRTGRGLRVTRGGR